MVTKAISLDNFQQRLKLSVNNVELDGFLSKQNVANFLNVPFAKFIDRFRPARMLALADLQGFLDATQYGPRCPQKVDDIHPIMQHMFEKLSHTQKAEESTCLHLNIYTPPEVIGTKYAEKLPVFAWIHGGGFNNGDNTTEFDGNHLVRRSIELNRPVIAVTINYRLNVFGFMSSRELIDEAKALGEVPVLNQGLNDQRLALQWIQSSIHHFGGDASKVTTAGESAGAACILYHLKGTQPLFQRAIIESSPALRWRSLDEAQAQFDKLVELTGIPSHASAQDKLSALRCLPADRLVELFDGSLSMPIEDPGWVVPHEHFSSAAPTFWGEMPDWCQHVILGHTEDEAALFFTNMRSLSDSEILAFVQSVIPEVPIEKFSHPGESILQQLIAWVTEDTFVRPAIEMALTACSTGHKVYFYSIATKDPFPGPLQGFSWHSIGVPMTFYQPPGRVYASIAGTQERMSSAHLDFVHGLEPWEAFGKARRHMCWDGEGSRMVTSDLAVEGKVNSDRGQAMNGLEPDRGLEIIGQALALQTK